MGNCTVCLTSLFFRPCFTQHTDSRYGIRFSLQKRLIDRSPTGMLRRVGHRSASPWRRSLFGGPTRRIDTARINGGKGQGLEGEMANVLLRCLASTRHPLRVPRTTHCREVLVSEIYPLHTQQQQQSSSIQYLEPGDTIRSRCRRLPSVRGEVIGAQSALRALAVSPLRYAHKPNKAPCQALTLAIH